MAEKISKMLNDENDVDKFKSLVDQFIDSLFKSVYLRRAILTLNMSPNKWKGDILIDKICSAATNNQEYSFLLSSLLLLIDLLTDSQVGKIIKSIKDPYSSRIIISLIDSEKIDKYIDILIDVLLNDEEQCIRMINSTNNTIKMRYKQKIINKIIEQNKTSVAVAIRNRKNYYKYLSKEQILKLESLILINKLSNGE